MSDDVDKRPRRFARRRQAERSDEANRIASGSEEEPLSAIVGMFASGLGDLAERHDDYLAEDIEDRAP
jgi:hypothetical protein